MAFPDFILWIIVPLSKVEIISNAFAKTLA